jgi:hypothetical protein
MLIVIELTWWLWYRWDAALMSHFHLSNKPGIRCNYLHSLAEAITTDLTTTSPDTPPHQRPCLVCSARPARVFDNPKQQDWQWNFSPVSLKFRIYANNFRVKSPFRRSKNMGFELLPVDNSLFAGRDRTLRANVGSVSYKGTNAISRFWWIHKYLGQVMIQYHT